jgi:hypothetical protein
VTYGACVRVFTKTRKEMVCDQTAMDLLVTSAVFLIAKLVISGCLGGTFEMSTSGIKREWYV